MTERQDPFADVVMSQGGFSLPDLKWRELLFIGALRPDGSAYVRDMSRPMPPFQVPDLFPEGVRFEVSRALGRVHLKRV
jgi:hypothetical protein